MIPSILASRFKDTLVEYMESTYPMTNPVFKGSISRFLEKENSMFHEPYISVKLPFRTAEHGNERFKVLKPAYPPYVHQNRAYDRLHGSDPVSTLVATGTGSGKTECFLYPILEYCYAHRGEPGIKALIIYPMNALASDQARRIAKEIYKNNDLRGQLTVGMYVGGKGGTEGKSMGEDTVITDHDTLLNSPPDILMTNYKMLDYLLVRPEDKALWKDNDATDALQFIVVDELHTFDGAQGTDLACLVRRLKSRLNIRDGQLCCVGTSATMGGEESADSLREYAENIFGEPFDDDAIVTEDRLTGHEFLRNKEVNYYKVPNDEEARILTELAREEDAESYLEAAINSWFLEEDRIADLFSDEGKVQLHKQLSRHSYFHSLMSVMDGKIRTPSEIISQLVLVYPEMSGKQAPAIVDSMLALISHARELDRLGNVRPFLQVQVQVWMRELRRVMAKVNGEQSELLLESDLNQKILDEARYLPVINCRDCGATGWAGSEDPRGRVLVAQMGAFYNQFFEADKHVRFIFPRNKEDRDGITGESPACYCPACQNIQMDQGSSRCVVCGTDCIPVWDIVPDAKNKNYKCPYCGGENSLLLIGLRSATAISAGISRIYASRFNEDKKMLAFSDNVQDASHRASFFNARTWRSTFRIATQHFVDEAGNGIGLDRFGDAMNEYWLSKMDEATFVDTFIPFNMSDDHAYENLRLKGDFPNENAKIGLLNDVKRRISLETILEYGKRSHVGRTLERCGSSMVTVKDEVLERIADHALPLIENEAGIRDLMDRDKLIGFMRLWTTHMRKNGAFALDLYKGFVEAGGEDFVLKPSYKTGRNLWMPDGYVYPLFLAPESGRNYDFEVLRANGWYTNKLAQVLQKLPIEVPGLQDAINILISEMTKGGLLKRMEGPKGMPVFGLQPEAFVVTNEVSQMRCAKCGQILSVHCGAAEQWIGVPCLRKDCCGNYEVADAGYSISNRVYRNGDPVRVHAREHTGLLERKDRENLETTFKHDELDHKSWDTNLLSCTPTLEMGIDIGDLSTVVLCQVPPGQAQYIQRVGRAGRKNGNALTVTVAGNKQHDLYFYQDPLEMISGDVAAPAVFLNASAVLERQFMAFCFDSWVRQKDVSEGAVPEYIKSILSKVDKENKNPNAFPFNLINFMQANMSRLERKFVLMFGNKHLSDETKERLRAFITGDEVDNPVHRLLTAFTETKKDRDRIQDEIKKIRKEIEILEAKPKDASFEAQKKELEDERKALSSVVDKMDSKNTFNFLSDEGILPNYAFPEAGITLKAILTRRLRPEEVPADGDNTQKVTYEYERGASSALSEFAPYNSFYAAGRKMEISRIDIKAADPETWRLCPNCNYATKDITVYNTKTCPRCNCAEWADTDQKCIMIRPKTVYSDMKLESSRSGDENDDRTSRFYTRQLLVDVDEDKDVLYGYKTTTGDLPFGYDFVKKATLREINFGESDTFAKMIPIAGQKQARKGFTICKYCGTVQKSAKRPAHTATCRAKAPGVKDPYESCMFLYREFVSEAVRILIPAIKMEGGKKLESFSAAIMLGLRKKFGSVDHLRFAVVDEPEPDSEVRKSFMVIYDSVPGGTGYLKQLTDGKDAMMDIFQLALEAMEECSCAGEPGKDGCYHCLYAFRQSGHINQISRKIAVDMLKQILSGRDSLVKIPNILQISVNTLLDSLLEGKFLEAVSQAQYHGKRVEMSKTVVNGKEGYNLVVGDNQWSMELQAPVTGDLGVRVPSKPDFLLRPRHNPDRMPVAVFTDGKAYHLDIIAKDVAKRMAIREGLGWRVWSLTWQDVAEKTDAGERSSARDSLKAEVLPSGSIMKNALQRKNMEEIGTMSAFDLLISYLGDPKGDECFETTAKMYMLGMLRFDKTLDESYFDSWNAGYKLLPDMRALVDKPEMRKQFQGIYEPKNGLRVYSALPASGASLWVDAEGNRTFGYDEKQASAVLLLDDNLNEQELTPAWRGFLHLSNLIQFIPDHLMVSEKALAGERLDQLIEDIPQATGTENAGGGSKWKEIIDGLFDESIIEVAKRLRDDRIPAPEFGMYSDEDDAPMAEFIWPDRKIAVQSEEEAEYRDFLIRQGWKVFSADYESISNALKEV